jgi:hypothetical protein
MMNQLRAYSQRVNASAARVVDSASTLRGDLGFATTGTTTTFATFAWNAMPPVHAPAICTHGKRYERRPQEMLT